MRRHTEASLGRLGLDALDLTQLHCLPTEDLRRGGVFDHLRRLRDDGLIRRFGASVESVEEGLLCLEQDGVSSLQVIFNIFRQKPARELFGRAMEKGVAIIVRLPLASGLLADKFERGSTFPESDHRNYNRDGAQFNVGETFAGLPFETGVDLARGLRPFVPAGWAMAELALRWCLDHEAVSVVIPGATSPEQARRNAAAAQRPSLSQDLRTALAEYYAEEVEAHIRGPY